MDTSSTWENDAILCYLYKHLLDHENGKFEMSLENGTSYDPLECYTLIESHKHVVQHLKNTTGSIQKSLKGVLLNMGNQKVTSCQESFKHPPLIASYLLLYCFRLVTT